MSADRLSQARSNSLASAVAEAEILVTTGAGGVGKTTSAAALGLAGARAGRRTLVLTIDPAKRLAQAMGIDTLDDSARQVELPASLRGPGDDDSGELWAMMLDMQRTFDELIDRHAANADAARAIKGNRIYQTLSSTLSGTQEYMAMEKLHELAATGDWDLIVVDTPPTRSALDFLDAPGRMTSFLDGKLLRLLLKPAAAAGKGYLRIVGVGATAFMKIAGRVTGMELLDDLAEFFRNFESMYDGFKTRAEEVVHLLGRPTSRFVVVTSPQPPPLREARFFVERLEQEGLHLAAVVVNRLTPDPSLQTPTDALRDAAATLADGGSDARAVGAGLALLADLDGLAGRERRDVEAALHGRRIHALVEIPLLAGDVHDLGGLTTVAAALTT